MKDLSLTFCICFCEDKYWVLPGVAGGEKGPRHAPGDHADTKTLTKGLQGLYGLNRGHTARQNTVQ
jgi:hypothetical protein